MSCPVFSDAESCFVGVEFVGVQLHLGPCSGGWFVCGFGVRCVLLPAFGGDEPFRVGVGAFHVDDPFAAPSGVFVAQAAVGSSLRLRSALTPPSSRLVLLGAPSCSR